MEKVLIFAALLLLIFVGVPTYTTHLQVSRLEQKLPQLSQGVLTQRQSKQNLDDQPSEGWGNIRVRIVVCDDAEFTEGQRRIRDKFFEVSENRGLKNVLFFLDQTLKNPQKPDVYPHLLREKPAQHLLEYREATLEPQAIVVQPDDEVFIKNYDASGLGLDIRSRHNDFSRIVEPYHIAKFNKDEDFVVERLPANIECTLGCDSFSTLGTLIVREEPYHSVSNTEGVIEIHDMPVGKWKFRFWHTELDGMTDLKNQSGEKVVDGSSGCVTIDVKSGQTIDLGVLEIDAVVNAMFEDRLLSCD